MFSSVAHSCKFYCRFNYIVTKSSQCAFWILFIDLLTSPRFRVHRARKMYVRLFAVLQERDVTSFYSLKSISSGTVKLALHSHKINPTNFPVIFHLSCTACFILFVVQDSKITKTRQPCVKTPLPP